MCNPTQPKATAAHRRIFSALRSAELGAAILAAAPANGYEMSLTGEDAEAVVEAVNQGIDAHLEACFVPERGDRYAFANCDSGGKLFSPARLAAQISPESLTVLVRRLLDSSHPAAPSLASGICQTLGLDLV